MDNRIVVISDDPALRDLLSAALVPQGFTLDTVATADSVDQAFAADAELVLLDELPTHDGAWLSRFQALRHHIRGSLVLLTGPGGETDRILGLELGADDSLSRPFNPRELLARLRAVLRRGRPHPGQPPVTVGDLQLDLATREVRRGMQLLTLTAVEFQLLGILLHTAGEVVSRETLATCGLGRPLGPVDRSLDVHMSRLRKKLGPHIGGSERIQSIRGVGYIYRWAPAAVPGA